MKIFGYIVAALFSLGLIGLIIGTAITAWVFTTFSQDLPDHESLKDYEPAVVARVHAGDGRLMAEFSKERRIFLPIENIPPHIKQAFISAEDKTFYSHHGVDPKGIARAIITNVQNIGSGRRLVGASTITQQVAKNFLLTNEVSYERKIKEAILAHRMEKALTKNQILELYLNDIFLGQRAYGVAAAALTYFGKPLDEVEIHEAAYLAALPKAPNNYHPIRHHDSAFGRRNWVIERMRIDGYLTDQQAESFKAKPLETLIGSEQKEVKRETVEAPYFAEEVRRILIEEYGEDGVFNRGLTVRTTLNPRYQAVVDRVFTKNIMAYDLRHGYRGPIMKMPNLVDWQEQLKKHGRLEGMLDDWVLAAVLDVNKERAIIGLDNGKKAVIPLKNLRWAAKDLGNGKKGEAVMAANQVLSKNDMIIAFSEADADNGEEPFEVGGLPVYRLRQVPQVQGGMVVLDPHTGRVLAMRGGWYYGTSEFNRATQAMRQPGSAFKPFVYLTALENGFTPSTLVLDAPFVLDQGPGKKKWRPSNYSKEFYGPTPIRVGVEKSKNLMTVRLADHVGMEKIAQTAARFGIDDDMPPLLANSLGATETTVLNLTLAYAQLVNGGKQISPIFIDRVQDRLGSTVSRSDERACIGCGNRIAWQNGMMPPQVPDTRAQVADPRHAYQIVSILEGVVQRGTGVRIRSLGYPLAGKTGTTNESKDAWFVGFAPDLAVGVYIGFDTPRTLGPKETGSSVAVPIFKDFMEEALEDAQPIPFRMPSGISLVQVNAKTGTRARSGDSKVIWEAFLKGQEPGRGAQILGGGEIRERSYDRVPGASTSGSGATTVGTGGLY